MTDVKAFLAVAFCLSSPDLPLSLLSVATMFFLCLMIWQVESTPPYTCFLSKVTMQSDVFLLLPWLYFMPSCLLSLISPLFSFVFFLPSTQRRELKTSAAWQIIACIWTFHLRVYTLYAKPACFMHCVGGKCILKYHASFESFSSENAKSLFGPSVPSRPAVCTYSVVAPRLACDFDFDFPRVDFSHLRGSLGATDDRLLSRCKLTFRFHN